MDNQSHTNLLHDIYSHLNKVRSTLGNYYSQKNDMAKIDSLISPNHIGNLSLQELQSLYERKISIMTEMNKLSEQAVKSLYASCINSLIAMQMNLITKDIMNLIVDDNILSSICSLVDQVHSESLIYSSFIQEMQNGKCYFLLNDISYKLNSLPPISLVGFECLKSLINI